jgi:site-specific recombinase XerC
MLWAVGARYGYDSMKLKAHRLRFFYAGHLFMSEEEKRAQAEALAAAMGGGKKS